MGTWSGMRVSLRAVVASWTPFLALSHPGERILFCAVRQVGLGSESLPSGTRSQAGARSWGVIAAGLRAAQYLFGSLVFTALILSCPHHLLGLRC